MAWACMPSSGTGLLVFSDDVTEDRSSRMNSEVYRDILSAQIQSNAAKLTGRRFIVQMDDDPKHEDITKGRQTHKQTTIQFDSSLFV